jgi:hypothetical protein
MSANPAPVASSAPVLCQVRGNRNSTPYMPNVMPVVAVIAPRNAVGLILCAQKDAAVAKYALEGVPTKVLAAEYRTLLPDVERLADELVRARLAIEET